MRRAWKPLGLLFMIVMLTAIAACGGDDSSDQAATAPAETAAPAEEPAPAEPEASNVAQPNSALAVEVVNDDLWLVGFGVFENDYPETGPIEVPPDLQFTPLGPIAPSDVTKEWTVCYFQDGLNNIWLEQTKTGAEQAGEYLGVNVVYQDAGWDSTRQLNQIENAIARGDCDGIVAQNIDPAVSCKVLSEDAPAAGIPVVITNSAICDDFDHTPGTVSYVGAVTEKFYESMTEPPFEFLMTERGGGKVAAIQGPAGWKGTTIGDQVYDRYLEEFPDIDLVQRLPGDFTTEAGVASTQVILNTNPDIDMILSQYDAMTLGIVQALKEAGKAPGEVIIGTTSGGDHTAFELIRDGWVLQGGIIQPLEESAHGIEILVAHLEGLKVPKVVDQSGDFANAVTLNAFQVEV